MGPDYDSLNEAVIPAQELRRTAVSRSCSDHFLAQSGLPLPLVHAAVGFRLIGTFQSIGFKHGRWLDTVLMQRALGSADTTLP